MYESVYHGVPLVTMPVFCDHDVNAAKAVADGYALRLELETLTTDKLSEYRQQQKNAREKRKMRAWSNRLIWQNFQAILAN